MHKQGHVQNNGVPFELARLPNEFTVVNGIVDFFEIQKGVNTVVTVQAGNNRHESPPDAFMQTRVSSNCRAPLGRVCTVKFGDGWFLDLNIDGKKQKREKSACHQSQTNPGVQRLSASLDAARPTLSRTSSKKQSYLSPQSGDSASCSGSSGPDHMHILDAWHARLQQLAWQ